MENREYMYVYTGSSDGVSCYDTNTSKVRVRLNDCTMHHNGRDGLVAAFSAVVELHGVCTHGIITGIHSNKGYYIHSCM